MLRFDHRQNHQVGDILESAGRPHHAIRALQRQACGLGFGQDGFEGDRVNADGFADRIQLRPVGLIEPGAKETPLIGDVEIAYASALPRLAWPHPHDTQMGLVGRLVLAEPDVPVNPEQAALGIPRQRHLELGIRRGDRLGHHHAREADFPVIGRPVILEPGFCLVRCEGAKKSKGRRAEPGEPAIPR